MGHGVADYRIDRMDMLGAPERLATQYQELPEDIKDVLTPAQFLERAKNMQSLDPDQIALELAPEPAPDPEKTP